MALSNARVSMRDAAKKGEIIEIKTLIRHPMETGYRVDHMGKPIPRDIVKRFSATYAGEPVFEMDLTQGVAANPFIAFSIVATDTAEMVFTWENEAGETAVVRRTLTVTE
ncbi:MAG: thiosulfate oxidation carrier complex protein SoxZ [Hyphomicrobiales bacterium]|nr:thiosulfate oxidation carrier complex protein SoxZ [Hyphomicrobiales bacterium]